jgi:hypothetical protein
MISNKEILPKYKKPEAHINHIMINQTGQSRSFRKTFK